MEDLLYIFDPGTNASRCPMPTTFEHLLKFITKDEKYISLHTQEEIVNINQQLDQTTNLMISNIIQRVIAQIIGKTDTGFVTIKGTDAGSLHVHLAEAAATLDILATLQTGENLIGKVQIEGTSQTEESAVINITGAGTHPIIGAVSLKSHHITSIMFTVTGAVTVELRDESPLLSGAMSFGDTGQPMGMTHNFGLIPLKCAVGKIFQIVTVGAFHVKGVVTYYDA